MSEIITETAAPKKRMLSGIKPSGDLTLGSYLGAEELGRAGGSV